MHLDKASTCDGADQCGRWLLFVLSSREIALDSYNYECDCAVLLPRSGGHTNTYMEEQEYDARPVAPGSQWVSTLEDFVRRES